MPGKREQKPEPEAFEQRPDARGRIRLDRPSTSEEAGRRTASAGSATSRSGAAASAARRWPRGDSRHLPSGNAPDRGATPLLPRSENPLREGVGS
jgi:hypothetical protein